MNPIRLHPNSGTRSMRSVAFSSKLSQNIRPMIVVVRVDKRKIIPPIVGVPDFFKCDCGPSSRIDCPNFRRFKKGMKIGPIITAMIKAVIIGNNTVRSMETPHFLSYFNYIKFQIYVPDILQLFCHKKRLYFYKLLMFFHKLFQIR